MTQPPIPLFIITHDRMASLASSVASYHTFMGLPFEVVIHDAASSYPPLVDLLHDLRRSGVKVVFHGENEHRDRVAETIAEHMATSPSEYYVLTDPDVAFDEAPPDILAFYVHVSEACGEPTGFIPRRRLARLPGLTRLPVGPMLRIDDLPAHYPKREEVIATHTRQFWAREPRPVIHRGAAYHIQYSRIDTTFKLCHRSVDPRVITRPSPGIRCYAPYWARHLDWYLDPDRLQPDQAYYERSASAVSHWRIGPRPDTTTLSGAPPG